MKRFFIISALTIILPTYATTMCAQNDTVAVILDPSIIATDSGSNATTGTWWAQFPFGLVNGTAAMLNKSCTQGKAISQLTDTNNGETKLVVGGEKYGSVCWCKITHPATSQWVCNVVAGNFGGTEFNGCLSLCGRFLANYYHNSALESGLFGSISN